MHGFRIAPRSALAGAAVAAALALAASAQASAASPHVSTGGVRHMLATSAELTAVVNPHGLPTSVYFQYGASASYGAQTSPEGVGSGTTNVKVGQTVAGLQLGGTYHYRAVASYGAGQVLYGRDRSFTLALGKPKLEIDPLGQVLVGSSFMLTGTLTGANNAGRMVALQATAYPYLDPFATIGPAALTNGSGRFAFRVANLSSSTEFRVLTIEPAPLYSPVIRVGAALHVTLHARASRVGLVRLYGTVSPTAVGAPVYIQLEKEALPSPRASGEGATRWVTEFITVVRRGSHTVSRFSAVVRVRHTGHYRAYVRLRPGRLSSGFSAQTVFLRARRATH